MNQEVSHLDQPTKREKKLWWAVGITIAVIFSTLFVGSPLIGLLSTDDIRAVFFLQGMLLVGVAVLMHAFQHENTRHPAIILGMGAIYLMLFLRLGMAERSHLIEYSVLAILIHQLILEKIKPNMPALKHHFFAWIFTFLVGAIDEGLQYFIPDRVCSIEDVFFNGMAAAFAIGSYIVIGWLIRIRKPIQH